MASICKKKASPYWFARYRAANGKQSTKSTGIIHTPDDPLLRPVNQQAAQVEAFRIEYQAKLGIPLDAPGPPTMPGIPGKPSFEEFVPSWLAGLGGDADYKRKMHRYMETVSRYLAGKVCWQIHRLNYPDFVNLPAFLLQLGYSPTCVTLHLKAVRGLFLDAEKKGLILVSPITPAHYLKNPAPNTPAALVIPQLEHLVNSTAIVDWRTAIMFGYYCAMDLTEAAARSWPEVNLDGQSITWDTSRVSGEPCPMTMPLHPALVDHLRAVRQVTSSVYVTPGLQGMSQSGLGVNFRKVLEGSGLSGAALKTPYLKPCATFTFSSLKLTFANHIGYTGLLRLSRFLRQLECEDLRRRVLGLPHLKLKPLRLLNGD